MKNLNLLRYAATFSLIVFLFSSCSKDSLVKEQTNSRNPVSGQGVISPGFDNPGIIQATVSPLELSIYMVVFNDDYRSEITYANDNGFIEIRDIPPGVYTVQLHVVPDDSHPRDYLDIIISDVEVNPGEITDLGNIVFE